MPSRTLALLVFAFAIQGCRPESTASVTQRQKLCIDQWNASLETADPEQRLATPLAINQTTSKTLVAIARTDEGTCLVGLKFAPANADRLFVRPPAGQWFEDNSRSWTTAGPPIEAVAIRVDLRLKINADR